MDEVDHHEDHCEACTDGGNLLCCDNCDFAFHFTCVDPPFLPDHPISEIDTWYCRRCAFMLRQKENPSKAPGPFGPIFDLSRSLNPHIFSLPTSIRRQSHAERDKAKDAREVELIDLLKNPDLCLPRYTAEEVVDTRRRKGVRNTAQTNFSTLPPNNHDRSSPSGNSNGNFSSDMDLGENSFLTLGTCPPFCSPITEVVPHLQSIR